ncbi:unnamed protein product [Adineta steineri]|uniref:Uncharacterized protein n=1 Tax=Adineta steineri TaxID=433720 RepID=A0A813N531_9BILA|nr:unnamed protein product [Adineta steineri]
MSCRAPNLLDYEQSIKLPLLKNLNNTNDNDVKLNLQLLNKYFEVQTLDETLVNSRNEFQTRTEHLQKRKDALHEKEIMFKQRILSMEISLFPLDYYSWRKFAGLVPNRARELSRIGEYPL